MPTCLTRSLSKRLKPVGAEPFGRSKRLTECPDREFQRRRFMPYQAINFRQKFGLFDAHWQPKVVAEMNDYQFKVVKLQGDFVWQDHKDTDETFIVIEGVLRIDFRDGTVQVAAGEMFVVPKGVE